MIRMLLTALAFATLMLPRAAVAENAASANRQGIDAYRQGDFEESVEHFTDAIVQDPESERIRFNRGTALSAAGNTEEAVSELMRAAAASEDSSLAAGAYYNSGNALLRGGELDAAIDQYKKAVRLDQASPDYRHNLEFAVRLRDQRRQQQQQQQNENQNDQQNPEENNRQRDDEQQQQEREESEEESRRPDEQEQAEATPDDSRVDTPMSIEEAERILDAIENEEREALAQRNEQMRSGVTHGNDW